MDGQSKCLMIGILRQNSKGNKNMKDTTENNWLDLKWSETEKVVVNDQQGSRYNSFIF